MGKKANILFALRNAGLEGVTNADLSKIALRYGGTLGDMYKEGYVIKTLSEGNGIFRYVLISEPAVPKVRPNALEVLLEEVESKLGSVGRATLTRTLESQGIAVKFKANTYKH